MKSAPTILAILLGHCLLQVNASVLGVFGPTNSSSLQPLISGRPTVSNGTFEFSAKATLFSPHATLAPTSTDTSTSETTRSRIEDFENIRPFSNASSVQHQTTTKLSNSSLTDHISTPTSILTSVSGKPTLITTNGTYAYSFHNTSSVPPQVSSKPTPVAVSNGTYAYALKNVSSSQATNESYAQSLAQHKEFSIAAVEEREPKAVFAHFMVGNCKGWDVAKWREDMIKAQKAHIDGFALNIAYNEDHNEESLENAYEAAGALGFKLIISFDYAGRGAWPMLTVLDYLLKFGHNREASYIYKGKLLVSTFEGWQNADDWIYLKLGTIAFFIPDWSSLGAKPAMEQANGVADGLFNWAAWPWGNREMDTYVDASYDDYLKGKEYMMPVSPWFYTNMPGYKKNWLWRGDSLWFDRWEQVDPQFVEIITWNDYGESHYIGPLHEDGYEAFGSEFGKAPFNYAVGMPHDGWREFLPYVIDIYKHGVATITEEKVVAWYRPTLPLACGSGGTTGNTASQLQIEFEPHLVAQDKIFFSALLVADATVSVFIGGTPLGGAWENKPVGNIGMFHGSVLVGGRTGAVTVEVRRNGVVIGIIAGRAISNTCENSVMNWNAWVSGATSRTVAETKPIPISEQECVAGWGPGNFEAICAYTCKYGYCPLSACLCTARGKPNTKPKPTYTVGFPAPGMSASFGGLCSFACNLDFCPAGICGTVEVDPTIPTSSPFLPPACIKGVGEGQLTGLCDYGCFFGFCPINSCRCVQEGVLNQPPAQIPYVGGALRDGSADSGLCAFACSRGYCPDDCVEEELWEEPAAPECNRIYTSLDEIASDTDVPVHCMAMATTRVLSLILAAALEKYETVLESGYDRYFSIYSAQVVKAAPATLASFLEKNADTYFNCDVTEPILCCSRCKDGDRPEEDCRYCDNTCTGNAYYYRNYSLPCPPSYEGRGVGKAGGSVYYNLKNTETWWNGLSERAGIQQEWVGFHNVKYALNGDSGCSGNNDAYDPICKDWGWYFNVPYITTAKVDNPKDAIAKTLADSKSLFNELELTALEMQMFMYEEDSEEVVDAASLPILMIDQAVRSMEEIVKIGEEIEEEQEKMFLQLFLTFLVMLIPIVGSAVGTVAGLANVGRMIAVLGELGAGALGVYDVVQDADNPLAIFGLILGVGAFADILKVQKAAVFRRSIDDVNIGKMGAGFASNMGKINSAMRLCRR